MSRNAKVLKSNALLRLPRRLGRSERHHVLALEWLPGRLLSEALADPRFDLSGVRHVGATLAELHRRPGEMLAATTRDAEETALRSVSAAVAWLCPHLAGRVERITDRLIEALQALPMPNTVIHHDFYAKQVLLHDERVSLLDLDEATRGEPAADPGNFVAHLQRDAIGGSIAPGRVEAAGDALLDGYESAGASLREERVALYAAVCLFRLAADPFRDRCANWPEQTQQIVETLEARGPV
jgi:Ser/Thr protein kinase RdoA (MazF antagonist)